MEFKMFLQKNLKKLIHKYDPIAVCLQEINFTFDHIGVL